MYRPTRHIHWAVRWMVVQTFGKAMEVARRDREASTNGENKEKCQGTLDCTTV